MLYYCIMNVIGCKKHDCRILIYYSNFKGFCPYMGDVAHIVYSRKPMSFIWSIAEKGIIVTEYSMNVIGC